MPTEHRLDPKAVREIVDSLASYNGKLWLGFEHVVMDSELEDAENTWEMLVINLNLAARPSVQQLQNIREVLTNIIHPRLPSFPKTISWMVHFMVNDERIHSIMGGLGGTVI